MFFFVQSIYQIRMTNKHHWQFYTERMTRGGKLMMLYCIRYAKKMILSEKRIINVDYEKEEVTFWGAKRKNVYVYEIMDFISKVIQHIPEKNFRLIRYYGFYANASIKKYEIAKRYWEPLQKSKVKLKWRQRQYWMTGIHPMNCPLCNLKLELKTVTYPKPFWKISIEDIMCLYKTKTNIQMKLKLEPG